MQRKKVKIMLWTENENISIIFSDKSDGDMYFESGNGARNQKVKSNRAKFFKESDIDPSQLVNVEGVHGNLLLKIEEKDLGSGALNPETQIKNTDGLITNVKNSYLMVTGADCFPVFFYDEKRATIGIAHCGWRGILAGIVPKIITEFRKTFNSASSDLNIWIGPGIKYCHFEVQKDVVELFQAKYPNEIIFRDNRSFIDLPAIIKRQLAESGVNFPKITEHPDCTFCEKNWFSARRDGPRGIGAMAFIIHLK